VLESYGAPRGCNMLFANYHGIFRSISVDDASGSPATPYFQPWSSGSSTKSAA
jgi:hypothetical protein